MGIVQQGRVFLVAGSVRIDLAVSFLIASGPSIHILTPAPTTSGYGMGDVTGEEDGML